jgi:hypothetical protein
MGYRHYPTTSSMIAQIVTSERFPELEALRVQLVYLDLSAVHLARHLALYAIPGLISHLQARLLV